jgi:PilZ domain-containing protein
MKYEGRLVAREWHARTTRIEVGYDVLVRCAAGDIPAKVINVSSDGFRLTAEQPLVEGWEVTIDMPYVAPVKGIVRWVAGLDAGGVFLERAAL